MLSAVEKGFATLAVPDAVRAMAFANLRTWLEQAEYAPYRPQLERLIARGRWDFLLDSFYRVIPFGTGGRRGPVGVGVNRINAYTITTSIQGHVDYLRTHLGAGPLRVVVAFDCRIFKDLRGHYELGLPNPLLGMRSRDFARLAAGVYAANGIAVCTVTGDDLLLATPELSFAIRHLGAAGGLNVSASHNHPDDNGAKFYTDYGGQPVAPHDEEMAEAVAAVQAVRIMPFDDAVRAGLVTWWTAADHEAYLDASLQRSLDRSARGAFIMYTPLNGTGRRTVHDVLVKAGIRVALVPSQAEYDGEFPHVKYRVPNPEVPEAFEAAIAATHQAGADAAFASDPDADRLGVVVPTSDGDRFLTGNEIGALLAAYIIESRAAAGTLPPHPFIVKTGVTTELMTAIARAHGVAVIGDLLVGFKYVGDVMEQIARTGRFGDLVATIDDFLFAAEESNGVLVTPALRDKDAAGGALLLAERIAQLKREGKTLVDDLDRIHGRYGYFMHGAYSLIMEGVIGLQRIEDMMAALRKQPPRRLAGYAVERTIDYWDERVHGPIKSSTDRASRNVVAVYFERGLKITARPSGTEPKLKIYVEASGDATAKHQVAELAAEATLQMAELLLATLNLRVPRYALALSQLVSVENRVDFAEHLVGELVAQLDRGVHGAALEAWVDQRAARYGKDGRFLVAPGIRACLEEGVSALGQHGDALRALFQLK
ncbi:MAG: phospho-sugar mutase [Deltaproteobacteria bacterium]|nr:phospho-sugar mutase [Deltaproteobacteria bacterium]MBI3387704.1 phospho-sugar mutase [Deltaproteobacteria bacterium]